MRHFSFFPFLLTLSAQLVWAASPPPIPYSSTWAGNSYGQGDRKWIQNNILGLHVSSNGVIYTNSWWDEAGRESGIYSGQDGEPIGMLKTLHASFGGGFAITGDNRYIYSSNWDNVRRCEPDGRPAPFPGGLGPWGDSFGVSDKPTGSNKAIGIRGLAIDPEKGLLFVSENNDNEIEVWSTESLKCLRKWSFDRPGPLAVVEDGSLWIISQKGNNQPARIVHFSATGQKLAQEIESGPDFDPTSLWYDRVGKRLLVSDNGPDQNIKIYLHLEKSRMEPDAVFGSSVYSGIPGKISPTKFGSSGLTGVATDDQGNYYVSMNGVGPHSFWHGGGTVLESWTKSGTLRWRKLGLSFVDCADADPASDTGDSLDIYDKYSRYRLDLTKTTAGTEWSYAGRTLNPIKYPNDPRFMRAPDGWDYTGGTFVRNIQGRKLLFVLSMQARRILVFRFNSETDGETAIPSGIWESQVGYDAGYDGSPKGKDFYWRDSNGNGNIDAEEFSAGPGMPNLGYGLWVDTNGDIWSCNHWAGSGVGIRRLKMQGFDPLGNPIYDYSAGNYTEFQRPEGSHGELRRIEYNPENDTMLVGSTSLQDGDRDAGNRFVKYNNWNKENRTVAWTLDPPMDKTKISSMTVAGDYLFLGYSYFSSNSREGTIRVFRYSDASYVGDMTPTPVIGSLSGTFDIPYAIRAFKQKNGEYLVFAEDDHFAKIVIHRWNPQGNNVVDTLDSLDKIDKNLSSAGWSIDGGNQDHFGRDAARATRTTDTAEHLVWKVDSLSNFAAAIYFDARNKIDEQVAFFSSVDGENWTPVTLARLSDVLSGGGWNVTTFRPHNDQLPSGTQYLKMQFLPTGTAWNVQLGRMELFGKRPQS
ncbi:MAG: hypothetical protein SFU85_03395 [Candidatus Methylacidiphilales bacterium]|nr:hypothetical protein [Candidatus Methylacidiphilales bacterium]